MGGDTAEFRRMGLGESYLQWHGPTQELQALPGLILYCINVLLAATNLHRSGLLKT